MREFQICSQNWAWIIFYPYFDRKTIKMVRIVISMILFFFGQNRGKILSKLSSQIIFGIFSSSRTFQIHNMKQNLKIYFWGFHSIFIISSLVRELKKQFLWEKKSRCFVIYVPWHGISSENPEKVEFGEKQNALWSMV